MALLYLTAYPSRFRIVVLSGDGIGMFSFIACFADPHSKRGKGPEVVDEAVKVLNVVSENSPDFDLKLEKHLFGGCAIDATGEALPASTLTACQEADAILMGMSPVNLLPHLNSFELQVQLVAQNGVSMLLSGPSQACLSFEKLSAFMLTFAQQISYPMPF